MEAPRIPSFFKSRRAREFNYKPWFYDPAKEEREKRNRMLTSNQGQDVLNDREVFRSKLHDKWRRSNSNVQQRNKSNLRLILIIALLVWVFYTLLN